MLNTTSTIALSNSSLTAITCRANNSFENMAFTIFMALILFCSVLGNSLVIGSICLSRELRRRVTVYFIFSLAISDMLRAIVPIPFIISQKMQMLFCHGLAACYWYNIGDVTANVASILNLFFIAIDRFVAIRYPFKHSSLFTASRVAKMIFGIWSFSILWSFVGIFAWESEYSTSGIQFSVTVGYFCGNSNKLFFLISYLGVFLIPLFIMTFTYSIILRIAISQIKVIASTQVKPHSSNDDNDHKMTISDDDDRRTSITSPTTKAKRCKENLFKKRELKATKSVAIVYFTFLLSWLPAAVVNIIHAIDTEGKIFRELRETNEGVSLFIYYGLTQILLMLSTMLNPIIYSFSNEQFRQAFRMVYLKIVGKVDYHENNSYYATHASQF